MALADLVKGNLAVAAVLGTTAMILPRVLPHLSPRLRAAVKAGVSLFLESQAEAEGGIIERLAETALRNVLGSLGTGSGLEQQRAADEAVETFKRTARRRARRTAEDGPAHRAHYQRHIAALRRALAGEQARHIGDKATALQRIALGLDPC